MRETRFALWALLGLSIAAIWCWGWADQRSFRLFEDWLQGLWGADRRSPWWLRGDALMHLVVAFAACCFLAWGRRLFHLRLPWWLPSALVVAVALVDETVQAFGGAGAGRAGQWSDLVCGGLGAALGLIPGWRLRSRRKDAPAPPAR